MLQTTRFARVKRAAACPFSLLARYRSTGWEYRGVHRRRRLADFQLQGRGRGQHLVEDHHLIPRQVASNSSWLQTLSYNANGSHNLMLLPTRRGAEQGIGGSRQPHSGSHGRYNAYVEQRLQQEFHSVRWRSRDDQLQAVHRLESSLRCELKQRRAPWK